MAKHLSPHLLQPIMTYRIVAARTVAGMGRLRISRPRPIPANRAEYILNWRAQRYIQGLTAHGRKYVTGHDCLGRVRTCDTELPVHTALVSHSNWLKTDKAKAQWREQARKRVFELREQI